MISTQIKQLLKKLKATTKMIENFSGKLQLPHLILKQSWSTLSTSKIGKESFPKARTIAINTIMHLKFCLFLHIMVQLNLQKMKQLKLQARTFNALSQSAKIYSLDLETQTVTMQFMLKERKLEMIKLNVKCQSILNLMYYLLKLHLMEKIIHMIIKLTDFSIHMSLTSNQDLLMLKEQQE